MRTVISFLILFFLSLPVLASPSKYGVVRGSQIPLREKPDATSKALRQMLVGELVYNIERSEREITIRFDEADFWYKVETQDGKTGWIYGSNLFRVDADRADGKIMERILDCQLTKTRPGDKSARIANKKMRICYRYEFGDIGEGFWYVKYDYKWVFPTGKEVPNRSQNIDSGRKASYVYKISEKQIELVHTSWNNEWYFFDGYLVEYNSDIFVAVYDPAVKRKGIPGGLKVKAQIHTVNYNIWDDKTREFISTGALFFDPTTRIVTVRIKDTRTDEITEEKYKLEKGQFIRINDKK